MVKVIKTLDELAQEVKKTIDVDELMALIHRIDDQGLEGHHEVDYVLESTLESLNIDIYTNPIVGDSGTDIEQAMLHDDAASIFDIAEAVKSYCDEYFYVLIDYNSTNMSGYFCYDRAAYIKYRDDIIRRIKD